MSYRILGPASITPPCAETGPDAADLLRDHLRARDAAGFAYLSHCLAAGHAVSQVIEQVGQSDLGKWLEANCPGLSRADALELLRVYRSPDLPTITLQHAAPQTKRAGR